MAFLFKPTYSKLDPVSGKKIKHKAAKWYISYRDADDILRRVPGHKSKDIALQMAARLEREAGLAKEGIVDPFVAHRKKPLTEHLTEFTESLKAKGITAEQVGLVTSRCRKIVDGCGFIFIADLSASRVHTFLAELRGNGIATQTSNHYLRAIKQFSRWLVRDRRMADDPLAPLEMMNAKLDRRRTRRALSEVDLARLLEIAEKGKTVRGLTGPDRSMLYRVAIFTGYRASELGSVTSESFDLNSRPPKLSVAAGYSKRRRSDSVPLHPELVKLLRPWLAQKPPQQPVWPGKWADRKEGAAMLRVDLKAAGIDYTDEEGRVIDFHGLRHTFASRLARAGVSVQQAKELMRHSDVNLTMNTYTHLELHDTAGAIESLPGIGGPKRDDREALKATGTVSRLILPLALPEGKTSLFESPQVHEGGGASDDFRCDGVISIAEKMQGFTELSTERGGFEPPVSGKGYTGFRNRHNQPLCHLSYGKNQGGGRSRRRNLAFARQQFTATTTPGPDFFPTKLPCEIRLSLPWKQTSSGSLDPSIHE